MKTLVVAIIEKNGKVLGEGTNWHVNCKRMGQKTGSNYNLCKGCRTGMHAEQQALRMAKFVGWNDLRDATIHIYGHDHACESCLHDIIQEKMLVEIHPQKFVL